jgi:anthranilate phosphoribosyltransferase
MIDLIQEFGRGKKASKHLSYAEASRAADSIMDGSATPAQTAAFLMAQQIKLESTQELLAFIDSLRHRAERHPIPGGIDCAGPYDGRVRSFMATLATAFVLVACRLPVTLHSSPALLPRRGLPLMEVLVALGVHAEGITREAWIHGAEQSGCLFVPTEIWCPPLAAIRSLRQEIGIRTIFNTAEQLLRPSDSPYMVLGVHQGNAYEKAAEWLQGIGVQRALIIQGAEGSEDARTDRRTRIVMLRDEVTDIHIVDPHTFSLHAPVSEAQWTAKLQAQATMSVLKGHAAPALRNAVLLNSALRLWVAERTESIEEGIEYAKDALDHGMAWKHYSKWRDGIGSSV